MFLWNSIERTYYPAQSLHLSCTVSISLFYGKYSNLHNDSQLGKHVFSETIMDASEFRGVVVAEVLKLIKEDRYENQGEC